MNPWNKFRKTKRLSLAEFGLDDFWVEISPMVAFSQRTVEAAMKEDSVGANAMFKLCVVAWNITDPDNESITLPTPKEDITVFDKLPTMIMAWIAEKISEFNNEVLPPALTKMSSQS
jgi:hypothetical protein